MDDRPTPESRKTMSIVVAFIVLGIVALAILTGFSWLKELMG